MLDHRQHHVAHLAFVLRGHQNDVRIAAKIRDVEQAVMRRAVAADDAGTVHSELHVEILQTDVVNELIESRAAEKSNRSPRPASSLRTPSRRKCDGVLFGNADVERPLGKFFEHLIDAGAVGHRGC